MFLPVRRDRAARNRSTASAESSWAEIAVARPGPDRSTPDGWAPYPVLSFVLGGSPSARIDAVLREEKGYTYSPSGDFTTRRAGSLLEMQADVRNEVTAATLLEVFYELDRMAATKPAKTGRWRA